MLPPKRFTEALAAAARKGVLRGGSRQAVRASSDHEDVPLALVTGPANAAKAGEVLGGLRARVDEEPILVVPAFQDVEHAQRELAERGAVFGVSVLRFDWLFREIARRAGDARAGRLRRPARADRRGGGARAPGSSCSPSRPPSPASCARRRASWPSWSARWWSRPASPRRCGPGRPTARGARYAEEVAAIYRGYRDGLEAAGLADPELFAWHALDALRRDPPPGAARPVFVYGFDDFDPLQLDALDTLASTLRRSTSWCRSRTRRAAPRSRRWPSVHQELLARGGAASTSLPPLDDHYAARVAPRAAPRGAQPVRGRASSRSRRAAAVEFHSAAGQRAEIELAGARGARPAARRHGAGRHRGRAAPTRTTTRRCSSRSSAPTTSRSRSTARCRSRHTGLGRGLLALVRCAVDPDAPAEDLLAWLRTPGLLKQPGLADRLEAQVRRAGAHERGRGARAVGERALEARRPRPAARGARRRAPSSAELGAPAGAPVRRSLPPPRRRSCAARSSTTRACSSRRATRSPSCAPSLEADPRTRLEPRARAGGPARAARAPRRAAPARPRPGRPARGDPRAPLRGRVRLRPAGGRVPRAAPRPSRSCPTRTGARSRSASGLRAAGARGPARPRALPLLRLLLARGAAARAVVALERRGGQPAVAVVLRRGRARPARAGRARVARARCRT